MDEVIEKKVTVSLVRKGLKHFPPNNDLFRLLGLPQIEYNSEHVVDIDMSRNVITHIPKSIDDFVNVVSLDLSNNQISNLPPELLSLQKLKSFNCKNNRLTCASFPKEFGKSFPLLESLNLGGNLFINFPSEVTEVTSLQELLIGANRIRDVPPEIENLQR